MTTVPFHSKPSAIEALTALSTDPHAPLSAMIEIADRCNEVCVHCYQIQGQKGELETDDWRTIIDELADMGVVFLVISGGEATLRHDFLELVEHARDRRFAVKIYTNGLTMTRELAQRLAELAVQEVQISLYSPRAEMHDWVTKVPGSFVKTTDAVRYLVEAGVKVLVKSPVMSINIDDRHKFIELAGELGADYSMDPSLEAREDGDREPEALRVSDEAYLAVKTDPAFAKKRVVPPPRNLAGSVCSACSGQLHIEANGELQPCTMLGETVGHAIRDGIRNAWEKSTTGLSIRSTTWGDLPGCRACDLRDYCTRCFASSRHETGDALAPYPSACRRAKLDYQLVHARHPVIEPREGRDGTVGPYRKESEGVFSCADVVWRESDGRLVDEGWVRSAAKPAPSVRVRPGELVQIRRPGSNKVRREVVPKLSED